MSFILYAVLGACVLFAGYLYATGDNTRRWKALKRLVLGVPYFLLMFVLGGIFATIIVATFALDVVWEVVTGRQGFTPEGQMERLWAWRDYNTRYIVYGNGDRFRWIP
jgi:hypothetical protein